MKVIKKGVLPVDLEHTLTGVCYNCGCEVEIPSGNSAGRVDCPTEGCHHYINLERQYKLPPMNDDGWKYHCPNRSRWISQEYFH